MKAIDEIRETLVSYLIIVDKITVVLHVVDIRPHHIKGDVVASVTLQDTLEDIQASIAVSALVPSKTPLRNKYRLSN
jgi:hypothetical protein